jgi:hypothetical protein
MATSLHPEIEQRLDKHRLDFSEVTGRPFEHFFCPILAVDEASQLIRGHVINSSYKGSPGSWVVQRADVDNFFGAFFEADFEALQHRDRATPITLLTERDLVKKFQPRILKNGEPVSFTSQPFPPSAPFVRVELGDGPGAPTIGLKMRPEEMIESARENWEFVVFKDARVSALVSLIKAAHLTLFHLLGYRYARTVTGHFVGYDILGRFYVANRGRPKQEILANAWSHFYEFRHMFRPLLLKNIGYEGTVRDRKVLFCHGSSGGIWAMIVLVRTAEQMNAVMVPAFGSADSVATFLGFLNNESETIQVSTAEFDIQNQRWIIYSDREEKHWPKQGLLYPDSSEPSIYPPEDILSERMATAMRLNKLSRESKRISG